MPPTWGSSFPLLPWHWRLLPSSFLLYLSCMTTGKVMDRTHTPIALIKRSPWISTQVSLPEDPCWGGCSATRWWWWITLHVSNMLRLLRSEVNILVIWSKLCAKTTKKTKCTAIKDKQKYLYMIWMPKWSMFLFKKTEQIKYSIIPSFSSLPLNFYRERTEVIFLDWSNVTGLLRE